MEKVNEETARLRPNYYKSDTGKQVWDYIQEMGLDFFQGNVLKYMYRYKGKNGLEDLKKAKTYLEKMISVIQAKEDLNKSPGKCEMCGSDNVFACGADSSQRHRCPRLSNDAWEIKSIHGRDGVFAPIELKTVDNTKKPEPYESNGQYWIDRHSKFLNIPYSQFRLVFLRAAEVAEQASKRGVDFKDAMLHQMSGDLGYGFQRDEKAGDS